MPEPTPDPVAAYLEQVRQDLRTPGEESTDRILERHVPALLALVGEALKLAAGWSETARKLDARSDRLCADGHHAGGALASARAQSHEDCGRALLATLAGEVPGA